MTALPANLADLVPGLTGGSNGDVTAPPPLPPVAPNARTKNFPFDVWEYGHADKALTSTVEAFVGGKAAFVSNLRYAELQDHWQNGDGWVGPNGGPDSAIRAMVLAGVKRQFTPVDAIGEALDRVVDGVLEREATVSFVPLEVPDDPKSDAAKAITAEADAMLALVSAWWDRVRLWEAAREATRRSRWSGRGVLRLWMPTAALEVDEAGQTVLPSGLAPKDAFSRLALQSPFPGTAARYVDEETQRSCAIFRFKRDGIACAEVWYVDHADPSDTPRVIMRLLRQNGTSADYDAPLAGHVPFAEMQAPLLVTEPVRRQQARLNFMESIVTRTGETAGFPERYLINAEPNGVYFDSPPSEGPALSETVDADGKTWYLHEYPRTLGGATTTDLRGVQTTQTQPDGTTRDSIATPGVHIKEPTDPAFAINGAQHARATIVRSVRQAHVLEGSAGSRDSGEAQKQKRADHEKDLHKTAAPLADMLRDILAAAITWAGQMTSDREVQTFLTRFRVQVVVTINAGPVSSADRLENANQVEKGLMPLDTALAENGVEDVQAAKDAIARDPRYLADLRTRQGAALTALTAGGMTLAGAMKLIGFTDDEITQAVGGDETGNPTTNGGVTQ